MQRSCTSCRVCSHSVDATQGEGRKIRCSANDLCDREDVIDDDFDDDDDDDDDDNVKKVVF